MLNDSAACSDAVSRTVEPELWWWNTADAYTKEDMKRNQDKHSPTTRKDSTVPSSYSVQQLKLSSLLSPRLFSRCLTFSPSPSLCHLTSSVSPVCLTDSKSPSLFPRSLCLPCQSPPSLPTLSSSSAGLCPCHSPSLAYFLSFLSPLSFCLFCLPLTLFFPSPTRSLLSLYPQPSVLLLCPCLLISSVSSPVLLLSSSLTQIAWCLPPPTSLPLSHLQTFPSPLLPSHVTVPPSSLSLSSSVLFLHVGELTGAAGTTWRGSEVFPSLCSPFQTCTLLHKCAGNLTSLSHVWISTQVTFAQQSRLQSD